MTPHRFKRQICNGSEGAKSASFTRETKGLGSGRRLGEDQVDAD